MQENNRVNNALEDSEIFVYPSILSGDDKIMMIVSDILLGNQSIKSSAAKYNIKVYIAKICSHGEE
jgi:hypothetical protein